MGVVAVAEPTRVCAGSCAKRKPWSDFHAKTKWADGTMRQPQAYCKRCQAERTQQWRIRNPHLRRAQAVRQYASLKSDPERWATKLANQRHNYHAGKGSLMPIRAGSPEPCPMLPAAPFVAWLRTLGTTPTEIGHACGIAAPQVYDHLRGRNRMVSLDVVDRACLHADADLNSIYPLPDGNPIEEMAA